MIACSLYGFSFLCKCSVMADFFFFFEQQWCHFDSSYLFLLNIFFSPKFSLSWAILSGNKTKWLKKNEKDKTEGKTFRWIQWICAGISFQINFKGLSWTFMVFSSCLVEGLVMALTTVILDTFSYFTFQHFHLHSLYKRFPCSFFVFVLGNGGASLWKKVFSEQYTSAVLNWTYMYFCNVLKNQYKKANTSINVAIALWQYHLFYSHFCFFMFFQENIITSMKNK